MAHWFPPGVDWIVYFYLMLIWICLGAIWHVIVLFSPICLSSLLCFKSMVLHAQVGGTIIGNTASYIKCTKWHSQNIQKLIPLKYCPSIATKVWLLYIYLPRSSLKHKVEATAPAVPLTFTQHLARGHWQFMYDYCIEIIISKHILNKFWRT